jgi:hypothetical protein
MAELAQRYREGRNRTLLEALACSAAVMGLQLGEGFDPSSLTPEMTEAFHLAFPNLDITEVGNYSGEALEGLLTAWKGKLFEVSVRDRLNDGEWVGSYHLEPGQTASLAESATQPGWDLQILNADGTIAEQIQLKSTDYVTYVEQALDRYPEYQVLATSELAGHEGAVDGLVVSNISDAQLEAELSSAVSADSLDLLDIGLPLIPMALNTYWVATGKRPPLKALTNIALSSAVIWGGSQIGDLVADTVNDMAGDAILEGVGAVVLDGFLSFGLFSLGRLLYKAATASDKQAEAKAKAAAARARAEKEAIDGVFRHIDEASDALGKTLALLSPRYLPPPAGAT